MIQCYTCLSTDTILVYNQNNVVTFQNVLLSSLEEARKVPRGNIDLYFCRDCTLLFNASFDEKLVGYGERYDNAQNHSPVFETHINRLTHRILEEKNIKSHRILEIGCGNGYFLSKLILKNNQNCGFGYDRSLTECVQHNNITLINRYYDESEIGFFDIIISRHVVEHILDNNSIISLLKKKNVKAKYFIETPSLEWIIKQNAFYDIFYEHCSYYSQFSLCKLFNNNHVSVDSIQTVFENQYLWLESTDEATSCEDFNRLSLVCVNQFFDNMLLERAFYFDMVNLQFKNKKIAIWGAGAKGVTFVNYIDPNRLAIKYIIDINPKKAGKFLPGTGHPIVGPEILFEDNIDVIIIMNPNYKDEIMNIASNKDYDFVIVGASIPCHSASV